MEKEKGSSPNSGKSRGNVGSGAGCGGFYFVAFVGAAVYFIQRATTFTEGLVGFFKALFWPGVILYEVLRLLNL